MTITPITNNYTVGRGEVHLAGFPGGVYTPTPGGRRYIGNNPAFGFNITTQELDHMGMDHGVAELDMSITTSTTRAGSFTVDNIDSDNLAMLFLGSASTNSVTSATAISETFQTLIGARSYQLGMSAASPYGRRNITNVAVKVATVTKTLGTDYTVDLARGTVRVLPASEGGTIVGGTDSIVVTYDQVAYSNRLVISGNTPFVGSGWFEADNPQGENKDYFMPYVRITPNGEFALKAENAVQVLSFNMKILKAPGRSAVYTNGTPIGA